MLIYHTLVIENNWIKMNDPSSKGHVTYNRNPIPRHYVATLISVIHSPSPISISSLSLSLSLSTTHSDREHGIETAHSAGDTWKIPPPPPPQ